MINSEIFDVAIIGAGPSGLACASGFDNTDLKVHIFEKGKDISLREHKKIKDIEHGVGGAGLFSDGKISFYPSGSRLYQLGNVEQLQKSHNWLIKVLDKFGISHINFPDSIDYLHTPSNEPTIKSYPSFYATLQQRLDLITFLSDFKTNQIFTDSYVNSITKTDNGIYALVYKQNDKLFTNYYKKIIFASGKYCTHWLSENLDSIELFPLKYEIGVRIEFSNKLSFFKNNESPDIKYIWHNEDYQARTFCTCRNGEIWSISSDYFNALSGRSDGSSTNYNNLSLLLRFEGNHFLKGLAEYEFITNKLKKNQIVWQPIKEFLDNDFIQINSSFGIDRPWYPKHHFLHDKISNYCSHNFYLKLKQAITKLISLSPDLIDNETVILFPTIEGVGYYPYVDSNLKIFKDNIWFAGDSVGIFRGIVPALISGHYISSIIKNSLTN